MGEKDRGKLQTDPEKSSREMIDDVTTVGFDDDQWVGKIYGEPSKLPLSVKDICFHHHDAKGNPTGVIDHRIFQYITHTQHIFVCGGVPYIYEGGYYHADFRGTMIKTLIKDCCLEQFIRSTTTKRIYELFLQDWRLEKTPDELNHYSGHYINFENGMYDAIKKKVYPHNAKILSTNQLPWSYTANGSHGRGTEIEKFLKFAVPKDDDREMLLEYIGLCCTKDVRQQKMLVICGQGGTGKSTIINLIQKLVGKRNISNVPMSSLGEKFQAINMMGKLLNSCADLEIDALDDVTMVKKLVGEDAISDSYKGKDIVSFDNYAKLLFSTNELPLVRNEKTAGFYRRLLILPMNEKPDRRDPRLIDRLEEELPYLLHLAMDAMNRMYERGNILESENSKYLVQQLRNDSDTIEAFIFDMCVTDEANAKVSRSELYEEYEQYCKDSERQAHKKQNFFKALANKGFGKCMTKGTRMFKGIRLKGSGDNEFVPIPESDDDMPFG